MAMGALVGVEVRIVDCKWAGGRAGMVPAGAFEQREGRDPAAAGGMRDRRQLAPVRPGKRVTRHESIG
jgi:hypothetical protein